MKKILTIFLYSCFFTNVLAVGFDLEDPKTITAPKITYVLKTDAIQTVGNTEIINDSGQKIVLQNSDIQDNGDKLKADDIELWLGQNIYMQAESLQRNEEETIATNALFTACDGCDSFGNAWEISTTKAIHSQKDHTLYFYNPVFWIYSEIPIFYFPYLDMPDPSVKYKSGLLMPDIKSTNNMGTQINIPIYINISDHHDLTPTLSYITKENPLFQLEHRLNLSNSEFRSNGSFTKNKEGDNRWHIFNTDTIELGNNLRAEVNIQRASDKTYLQKYGFYNSEPYLDSGAKLELFGKSSYAVADTHIFQELRIPSKTQATPSGDILPNIKGTYQSTPLFAETFLTLKGDIMAISNDDSYSQRYIGETRITSPWTIWGGNRITASVSTRYDIYNFKNTVLENAQNYTGTKSRFLPSGYVEWGLPLFNYEDDWMYIIEPKARLTLVKHLDNDVFQKNNDSAGRFLSDSTLFSENRFSGLDVWENGNFADYGVRLATFNHNHDVELFVGQSYDFTNANQDKVGVDSGFHNGASDYVGRLSYSNSKWLRFATKYRFSEKALDLKHIENSARIYHGTTYLNLGHIWNKEPIDILSSTKSTNELVTGAGLQFTKRIGIKFNSYYNIVSHFFQQHSGGIFYTHPCYFLSLEYHRDNTEKQDYKGNTTYQFRFGVSIDGKQQ